MIPGTDLCDTCEMLKKNIQYAKDIDEKNKVAFNLKNHKNEAEKERQYYNNNITTSNTSKEIAHICYDWAQNVPIPFSPQQAGQIYFKTAFAVHIFGVCSTKQKKQLNYLIGENEFPNGSAEKGANTTINLVFNALNKLYQGEQHLKVTCDNCTAQNKNNLSLFFWAWLTMIGMYDTIEVSFMIPGHTKFLPDGYFGNIKALFRKTRINTVNDVEQVVKKSTKNNSNHAVRYNNGNGWLYYDFESFLKPHFRELPGIQKYRHFWFKRSEPGKVFAQKEAGENFGVLMF